MAKQTRKFVAAVAVAREVLPASEHIDAFLDSALLYGRLESLGWFWDSDVGRWSDESRSTSMFESDDGDPSGVVRLRLMAHPGDMDFMLRLVREGLELHGCKVVEVSEKYRNRRGAGVRIYVSAVLPDDRSQVRWYRS